MNKEAYSKMMGLKKVAETYNERLKRQLEQKKRQAAKAKDKQRKELESRYNATMQQQKQREEKARQQAAIKADRANQVAKVKEQLAKTKQLKEELRLASMTDAQRMRQGAAKQRLSNYFKKNVPAMQGVSAVLGAPTVAQQFAAKAAPLIDKGMKEEAELRQGAAKAIQDMKNKGYLKDLLGASFTTPTVAKQFSDKAAPIIEAGRQQKLQEDAAKAIQDMKNKGYLKPSLLQQAIQKAVPKPENFLQKHQDIESATRLAQGKGSVFDFARWNKGMSDREAAALQDLSQPGINYQKKGRWGQLLAWLKQMWAKLAGGEENTERYKAMASQAKTRDFIQNLGRWGNPSK